MSQRQSFLAFEADAFFARNREQQTHLDARASTDPVLRTLRETSLAPRSVLEIGCSAGWRLAWMRGQQPGLRAAGLDPSARALAEGAARFEGLELVRGTAERLPFGDRGFDLVILGFCLYVIDRDDLFRVAAEVDRVVARDGHVLIHDFHAEHPYRNPYRDLEASYSYKMDYPAMFLWNPAYQRIAQHIEAHPGEDPGQLDAQTAVTVLHRNAEKAYAEGPVAQRSPSRRHE